MKKASTRDDYYARISRVTRYIANHLFEDLSVETLADVAAFSPYHFHRIYRVLARETVNETIRRVRLHHAAGRLVRSEVPVAEIAKEVRYGSVAAFTRAFGQLYGLSPAAYRRQGTLIAPAAFPHTKETEMTYDVTIADWQATRLAAVHHTGSYMEIGAAFEQVFAWAMSKHAFGPQTRMIGIFWDDPQSVDEKTLRSAAGITVDRDLSDEPAVSAIEIPALKTASILHQGPYAELQTAYHWIYSTWLPNSDRETGDFPPFEEYLNDPKTTAPADLQTRIHIPIAA